MESLRSIFFNRPFDKKSSRQAEYIIRSRRGVIGRSTFISFFFDQTGRLFGRRLG